MQERIATDAGADLSRMTNVEARPAAQDWPESDLERLGRCPVCGSASRALAVQNARDGVFETAGRWDYHRCRCGILYLDPRPSEAAIRRAYERYYTHHEDRGDLAWRAPGFRGNVRRAYLNARYGYRLRPASLVGRLTWRMRERAVRNLDFMIRHLPAPPPRRARVLDVGCGNGGFLRVAQDLGYEAVGIDPDPCAVGHAEARGLAARTGRLPGSGLERASFDHLFLNHVLEHLHAPLAALEEALSLLVPGGRLWLSQPNPDGPGFARFGGSWRGLEPPRHLTLAGAARLADMLSSAGFERVELLPAEESAEFYYRQSLAISLGLDPEGRDEPPGWGGGLQAEALAANRYARADPARGESLTLVAWRPK
jgi:SAM-dependent methyltransferase